MKHKLSALDELRLEKEQLMTECNELEYRLFGRVDYVKDNFGRLLVTSIFSFFKSGKKNKNGSDEDSSFFDQFAFLKTVVPYAWEFLQPILIGMVVKKAQSFFFKKKKKS